MERDDIKCINACFQEHVDVIMLNPQLQILLQRNK
jgi:hypothetical protein